MCVHVHVLRGRRNTLTSSVWLGGCGLSLFILCCLRASVVRDLTSLLHNMADSMNTSSTPAAPTGGADSQQSREQSREQSAKRQRESSPIRGPLPWSRQEDDKLRELFAQHAKDWRRIAQYLQGRSDSGCRSRAKKIGLTTDIEELRPVPSTPRSGSNALSTHAHATIGREAVPLNDVQRAGQASGLAPGDTRTDVNAVLPETDDMFRLAINRVDKEYFETSNRQEARQKDRHQSLEKMSQIHGGIAQCQKENVRLKAKVISWEEEIARLKAKVISCEEQITVNQDAISSSLQELAGMEKKLAQEDDDRARRRQELLEAWQRYKS